MGTLTKKSLLRWEAEEAVEMARENVANIIGANAKEIIFTSGATESNNLAIKGLADFYGDKKNHVITCVTEHKCVLESCRFLSEKKKFDVTYLPVKSDGLIDLKELKNAITSKLCWFPSWGPQRNWCNSAIRGNRRNL